MRFDDHNNVWLVRFETDQRPGDCLVPVRLEAKEYRTGRRISREANELVRGSPPYPLGQDTLFVTHDAPVTLGCHLALDWPMPAKVLDLHAEFRCLNAGTLPPGDYDLPSTMSHLNLSGEGVEGLALLSAVLCPDIDLPRALLRGRYAAAVARMEMVGIPIDLGFLERLRASWDRLRHILIEEVDADYGVFQNGRLNPRRWAAWVNRQHIPWPRTSPGRLNLRLDAFVEMAAAYPAVRPMKELRATLNLLRPAKLPIGPDGRNRCPLRPFAARTGRNAPSTSKFIFGPATWLRGLIKPAPGMALAYIDYEQQEFGIAAALSGDQAMMSAYRSGDPYLAFARQAAAVPADATKKSHRDERERFKHCALGVQYGMGARSLAARLGISTSQARDLLRLHRRTYPRYWRWSDEVERRAHADGKLQAAFGWTLRVGPDANPRSLRNFPLQANGAEMLRLACILLTEAGVRVCAPVHDALLIEAPADGVEQAVATCQQAMAWASENVLPGFPLRTDAKIIRHRYMDSRGRTMWDRVSHL